MNPLLAKSAKNFCQFNHESILYIQEGESSISLKIHRGGSQIVVLKPARIQIPAASLYITHHW